MFCFVTKEYSYHDTAFKKLLVLFLRGRNTFFYTNKEVAALEGPSFRVYVVKSYSAHKGSSLINIFTEKNIGSIKFRLHLRVGQVRLPLIDKTLKDEQHNG